MGTIKTTNIETITGSGTLTIGQSGETITIPSGCTITNNGTQTGFGGTNTPAFFAYANSTQSVATNTFVKAEFTNEIFDTDNNYASNRFTPTTAGKYVIVSQTFIDGTTDTRHFTVIYKNGSYYSEAVYYFWSTPIVTQIIDFNGTSDYVEIFMRQESGTTRTTNSDDGKFYFYGYKLIGV